MLKFLFRITIVLNIFMLVHYATTGFNDVEAAWALLDSVMIVWAYNGLLEIKEHEK